MDAHLHFAIDPHGSETPSRQIVTAVLERLARGALAAGDRLPSVRGLAAAALVNHNTVARAYRDLEQLGVVRGENGRGVFVTDAAPAIARREHGDETLRAFEAALRAALASGHTAQTLHAALEAAVAATERKSA